MQRVVRVSAMWVCWWNRKQEWTYNHWSWVRLPIDEGIVPVNRFEERSLNKITINREVWVERISLEGDCWWNWKKESTYNQVSWTRLPIDEGIAPLNRLSLSHLKKNHTKIEKFGLQEWVMMWFCWRNWKQEWTYKSWSLARLPIDGGIVPLNWLKSRPLNKITKK